MLVYYCDVPASLKMKPKDHSCEGAGRTTHWIILIVVGALSLVNNPVLTVAKYVSRISPGTKFYDVLNQTNYPGAYIYTYIFNVTNGDRFISGEDHNLKVEEGTPNK
ncbi:unnamed protein product [Leptidea sinapis]|uniref:Uncharacterized protein n=1 Tax=Leptidea sinapis TaxID=189913 RepID=A0A5E4QQU9_9NEOP|nr:unnamed protein product [Leptidea sinapis]